MENATKIKSLHWSTHIVIPSLVGIIIALLFITVAGELTFQFILSIILLLWAMLHLMILIKTKNPVFIITVAFYLFDALTFLFIILDTLLAIVICAGCALVFFILFMWALITRRYKWRYREVLELAAKPINTTADNFTNRPFPAAETSHSLESIKDFAQFLLKYTIAFPIIKANQVVIVIPENMLFYMLGFKNYFKDSYILFTNEGHVAVKIADKDYRKYNEKLTFDQLCNSLGQLFLEFLDMYNKGEAKSIIDKMNKLKFIA